MRPAFISCLTFCFLILFLSIPAFAIRCGNDVIRTGQSIFEVTMIINQQECGEIISKEDLSYKVKKKINDKETKTTYKKGEKWFVRIKTSWGNSAYCYEFTFRGTLLEKISTPISCQ